MIIYKDIEQGTDKWHELRRGRLGASEYKNVIASTGQLFTSTGQRSKSATAVKFMHKLALQLVCDDPAEAEKQRKMQYNWDIKWGNQYEPIAREWFRSHVLPVECVGYVVRHESEPVGCSPDGLIPVEGNTGWESGLEIKCPSLLTHFGWSLNGVLPDEHKLQVHGSMALTGLDRWYFLSYFPGVKPFLLNVQRDSFTEKVGKSLDRFIVEYGKERKRVFNAMLGDYDAKEVAA